MPPAFCPSPSVNFTTLRHSDRLRFPRLFPRAASLELGEWISWDRNTAFCKKCLGRLKRMEGEAEEDREKRGARLRESVNLLLDAIVRFEKLGLESEVGDCYSLLARTYLVGNKLRDARMAWQKADSRLREPDKKDYIDLRIVEADLAARSNLGSAEAIYTEVLANSDSDDAQKSEIFARAHLHRGRVRVALKKGEMAIADYRRAAEIWDGLSDPMADVAHWEIERRAEWVTEGTKRLLRSEPVGVRVRVARLVRDGRAEHSFARSARQELPEEYLRGLIWEARKVFARERPKW